MSNNQVKQRTGVLAKVQDQAMAVIQEDAKKGKDLAIDAVKSNAWVYPFHGILYFAAHRALWKPLMSKLVAYVTLSITVTSTLFLTTYVPQAAMLFFVSGPLAVFTTVVVILNESAVLTNTIARTWLLDDALLDTYDATLLAKGHTSIVKEGREIKGSSSSDPIGRLGRVIKSPFSKFQFSIPGAIRYVMLMGINLIPVVGPAVFVYNRAQARGKHVHDRYYQLKKTSLPEQQSWYSRHAGATLSFALVATVFEMIPVVSIVFTFTSAVGAALWAADLESKSTSTSGTTAPGLRQQGKLAEDKDL